MKSADYGLPAAVVRMKARAEARAAHDAVLQTWIEGQKAQLQRANPYACDPRNFNQASWPAFA